MSIKLPNGLFPPGTRLHIDMTVTVLGGGDHSSAERDDDDMMGIIDADVKTVDDEDRDDRLARRDRNGADIRHFLEQQALKHGEVYCTIPWILRHMYDGIPDINGGFVDDEQVWKWTYATSTVPVPFTPASYRLIAREFKKLSDTEKQRLRQQDHDRMMKASSDMTHMRRTMQRVWQDLRANHGKARKPLFEVERVKRGGVDGLPPISEEPWLHGRDELFRIRRLVHVTL